MWDSDVSYGDYYILVSTPIDLSGNSEKQAKYLAYIIKSISDELDIPMPDFGDDKSNEQIKWSYILKTDAALLHPKAVFSITKN